jgi:hypothetical protein
MYMSLREERMNLLPILKGLSSLVTSASIGAVVENAIRSTTPAKLGKYGKVLTIVGRVILTAYLSEKAAEYIEKQIDEVIDKHKKPVKEDWSI